MGEVRLTCILGAAHRVAGCNGVTDEASVLVMWDLRVAAERER